MPQTQSDKANTVQSPVAIINVEIEVRTDGSIYISSPDVPGLHLCSTDREALFNDIAPAIEELFLRNRAMKVRVSPVAENLSELEFPRIARFPKQVAVQSAA